MHILCFLDCTFGVYYILKYMTVNKSEDLINVTSIGTFRIGACSVKQTNPFTLISLLSHVTIHLLLSLFLFVHWFPFARYSQLHSWQILTSSAVVLQLDVQDSC